MNDKNLEMKYLVVKLEDIKKYMNLEQQEKFWDLFWGMIRHKKLMKRIEEKQNKLEVR